MKAKILFTMTILFCGIISNYALAGGVPSAMATTGGMMPYGNIILGNDGNLYGTTEGGGNHWGTVFKLQLDGTITYLHLFTGLDGLEPRGSLVQDSSGDLYGTTFLGGSTNNCGNIFKINPETESYSIIYTFHGQSDGKNPTSGVLLGGDGYLYGTTASGGANNAGVVYKINHDGTNFTVLHAFAENASDGVEPWGGLVTDNNSFVYGTTFIGGKNQQGTIFMVAMDGTSYNVLHSFGSGIRGDGLQPLVGLAIDPATNILYGVTSLGGRYGNGIFFSINSTNPAATYNPMYSFQSVTPNAKLTLAADGNFYTNAEGIESGNQQISPSQVLQLSKSGSVTTLYTFKNNNTITHSTLIKANGNFYGSTLIGGSDGYGNVFAINPNGYTKSIVHQF